MFVHYRCVFPNITTDEAFTVCRPYYSPGNGYYSGSQISGLRMALPRIRDAFYDEYNLNPCVDLMENYLCHYYFPQCNLTTGEITPACNSSCALLGITEDCNVLREFSYEELKQNNVSPPDEACSQTYRSFNNDIPPLSGNCLSIEG